MPEAVPRELRDDRYCLDTDQAVGFAQVHLHSTNSIGSMTHMATMMNTIRKWTSTKGKLTILVEMLSLWISTVLGEEGCKGKGHFIPGYAFRFPGIA